MTLRRFQFSGLAIARLVGMSTALVWGVGASAVQAQQVNNEAPVQIELPPLTIEGSQVELTPLYQGGQVATGSRAGMLGNRDWTPRKTAGAGGFELIRSSSGSAGGMGCRISGGSSISNIIMSG